MKDNKQRLFEVMRRLNPEFTNEANAINTTSMASQVAIRAKMGKNYRLATYGDLNQLINVINLAKKGEIGVEAGNIAIETIMGFLTTAIPDPLVAQVAKGITGALSWAVGAFFAPDDKVTNTWLDKLNIDDDLSAIIDNNVEKKFVQELLNTFQNEPPDKLLEPDFDINARLKEYLSATYNHRTVEKPT